MAELKAYHIDREIKGAQQCPFCGGKLFGVLVGWMPSPRGRCRALCGTCETLGPPAAFPEMAIEVWNRRVGHQLDGDPPPALER